MYGSGSGLSSIWVAGTVRGVTDDEMVAWEGFRREGPVSEDGDRRGVGVAGREVASAGVGWGGK